ncbi:MAG: hypothetical protein LBG76_07525 [Treponema sp.]|nr:hypothetical protein [Treponema sp.]
MAIRQTAPYLKDLAELCPSPEKVDAAPVELWGPIRERLERRYLRICFVQHELNRLNFANAKPGVVFDDFVLEQADFSVYRHISPGDFALFSGAGLYDYADDFYEECFNLNRKTTERIIKGAYVKNSDGLFHIRDEKLLHNPLFLSIMRTLHTSLNFSPLFSREDIFQECTCLIRQMENYPALNKEVFDELFCALLMALDNGGMVHRDGMKTKLSVYVIEKTDTVCPAITLRGTFYPGNMPHTITLVEAPAGR